MNWTTEFPTKPGYYWIRNYAFNEDCSPGYSEPEIVTKGPHVAKVEAKYGDCGGPISHFCFIGSEYPVKQNELFQAEWYGPIEPPV